MSVSILKHCQKSMNKPFQFEESIQTVSLAQILIALVVLGIVGTLFYPAWIQP